MSNPPTPELPSTPLDAEPTPEASAAPVASSSKKKISLKVSRKDKAKASAAEAQEKEAQKNARPKTPPPVDEHVAHLAMRRFVVAQLHQTGFSSASAPILDEIEALTVQFFSQVYATAMTYAHLSLRTDPNVMDVIAACEELDVDLHGLQKTAHRKRKPVSSLAKAPLPLLPPPAQAPAPSFLPSDSSDDEGNANTNATAKGKKGKDKAAPPPPISKKRLMKMNAAIPKSLKDLPKHFPNPPPKHTYLRTAPPTAQKRTLDSLEVRYQNSLLVQESLRSLVQGTEDPVPEPNVVPASLPNGAAVSAGTPGGGVHTPTATQQSSDPLTPSQSMNQPLGYGLGMGKEKGPPTLEEIGMGGLVNYEAVERTGRGTGISAKRKRWRV